MAAAARYDEPKRLKFAFGSSLRSLSYFSEQSGLFRDLIKSHVSDQNMRAFLKAQNRRCHLQKSRCEHAWGRD